MSGGWTLDQVAQEIRKNANKRNPVRTALLTGAGCSYQAGIPLARGFVEEIKQRYPNAYARAADKTYPICMGELSASDRHDLISEYIDKAKINWAHISIAQLMRAGFVDRVLTTNFDPLVMRACALLNIYPAVYDMAVVRRGFVADYVRDLAVFHLHGQRDGFVQLHKKEDVEALAEAIEPLFDDTARNRCWIVIGYSGANDPVFRALADRPDFPNRLFWVGFRDEEPSAEVRKALLDAGKDVNWISGYDPDTFLLQLAARLGCFPPGFFTKPFSHLQESMGMLAGFRLPGQDQDLDWAARARGWIEQAIATYEAVQAAAAAAGSAGAAAVAGAAASAAATIVDNAPHVSPPPAPTPPPPPPAASGAAASAGGLELEFARAPASGGAAAREGSGVASAPDVPADTPADAPGDTDSSDDVVGQAWAAMMTGEYDKVVKLRDAYDRGEAPELAEPLAWSLASLARNCAQQAKTADSSTREELLTRARQFSADADTIRPGLGATALDVGE